MHWYFSWIVFVHNFIYFCCRLPFNISVQEFGACWVLLTPFIFLWDCTTLCRYQHTKYHKRKYTSLCLCILLPMILKCSKKSLQAFDFELPPREKVIIWWILNNLLRASLFYFILFSPQKQRISGHVMILHLL